MLDLPKKRSLFERNGKFLEKLSRFVQPRIVSSYSNRMRQLIKSRKGRFNSDQLR